MLAFTGQQQVYAMKEIFMKNSAVFGTTDREQQLNAEAIRREASILERLQHDKIVRYYGTQPWAHDTEALCTHIFCFVWGRFTFTFVCFHSNSVTYWRCCSN